MSTDIVKVGIVGMLICTDDTDEVAIEAANRMSPTGISSSWQLADAEPDNPNRGPCGNAGGESRRHLRLVC
jgi:hypothetical protein